jgi:hypothetical protein
MIVDRKAVEFFVVSSNSDYKFIRDELLINLSEESKFPFLINGFISLQEKEIIEIPHTTGAIFIFCDEKKVPMSISKHIQTSVNKKPCPIIYSDEREAKALKEAIFESIPPFQLLIESLSILKQDTPPPLPLSFEEFKKIILKKDTVLYGLFPHIISENEKSKKKELKEAQDYVQNFIHSELENLKSTKYMVASHLSLIQSLKDLLVLLQKEEEPSFNLEFYRLWMSGYIKENPNKTLETYLSFFTSYFEKPLPIELVEYLKTLPDVIYTPTIEISKKSVSLDKFTLEFTSGVNLTLKEVVARDIKLDASIQVDSIQNGKLLNLSILS